MTDDTTKPPLATDVNAVKKDVENEVHPIVKDLWHSFEGKLENAKAWIETEWKKI